MSWNSLELAKLAVAISTPLTVLAVGWWIRQREQINGELIRKRIAIYDEVVPRGNDILCFFLGVGHWRELDPAKVIECKPRILHKLLLAKRLRFFLQKSRALFTPKPWAWGAISLDKF